MRVLIIGWSWGSGGGGAGRRTLEAGPADPGGKDALTVGDRIKKLDFIM
jgi:hypothetical protein